MNICEAYTDVSHGLGIPFGGLGTGYFLFGRHGFVNVNLDGFPEKQQTAEYPHGTRWDYLTDTPDQAPFALFVEKEGVRTLLQGRTMSNIEGHACRSFEMQTLMPLGYSRLAVDEQTDAELLMFSSVKPHDQRRSAIPACAIELTLTNHSDKAVTYTFGLAHDGSLEEKTDGELLILKDRRGEIAFGAAGGEHGRLCLQAEPHSTVTAVAAIGWYYPRFLMAGIADDDIMVRQGLIDLNELNSTRLAYERWYTNHYDNAAQPAREALADHAVWKADIEAWHNSMDVPATYKKLWFASYTSVITAGLRTKEGYYLEIEQPHGLFSTMDVCAYSTWLFLINWPEIERQDLEQYIATIPKEGPTAGKVWHSLWTDDAHYVEESTYTMRVWRYALWARDKAFLAHAFDSVTRAMTYAFSTQSYGHLINNVEGNQSYDAWKMPGIGAYVNNQWLFALLAYRQICRTVGKPEVLCGIPLDEFLPAAIAEYNEQLWDEQHGYWHAYRPNEQSNYLPFGDAIFCDQLFGLWMMSIDPAARGLLDNDKEVAALKKVYTHNRLEVPEGGYAAWTVGMLPEREKSFYIHLPEMTHEEQVAAFGAETCATFPDEYWCCGYHALSCWLSTELVLSSLLGYLGMEAESADVFTSVVKGIGRNVVATGEYNRAIDKDLNPVPLIQEPGKDTPRFPPYPRYKSSWEYLVRLLGITMDFDTITFAPFKTVPLAVNDIELAGIRFTVTVEQGWTRCLVNGEKAAPVINRSAEHTVLEFVK